MSFSIVSVQNGEAHARVLANNKRALENLFFLVAAEVTRLKFLVRTVPPFTRQSRVTSAATIFLPNAPSGAA